MLPLKEMGEMGPSCLLHSNHGYRLCSASVPCHDLELEVDVHVTAVFPLRPSSLNRSKRFSITVELTTQNRKLVDQHNDSVIEQHRWSWDSSDADIDEDEMHLGQKAIETKYVVPQANIPEVQIYPDWESRRDVTTMWLANLSLSELSALRNKAYYSFINMFQKLCRCDTCSSVHMSPEMSDRCVECTVNSKRRRKN